MFRKGITAKKLSLTSNPFASYYNVITSRDECLFIKTFFQKTAVKFLFLIILILWTTFWQLEIKCFRKSCLLKTHLKGLRSNDLVLSDLGCLQKWVSKALGKVGLDCERDSLFCTRTAAQLQLARMASWKPTWKSTPGYLTFCSSKHLIRSFSYLFTFCTKINRLPLFCDSISGGNVYVLFHFQCYPLIFPSWLNY